MIKQALVTTAVTAAPWWFFPNDEVMIACFTCWLLGSVVTTLPAGMVVGALLYFWLED